MKEGGKENGVEYRGRRGRCGLTYLLDQSVHARKIYKIRLARSKATPSLSCVKVYALPFWNFMISHASKQAFRCRNVGVLLLYALLMWTYDNLFRVRGTEGLSLHKLNVSLIKRG